MASAPYAILRVSLALPFLACDDLPRLPLRKERCPLLSMRSSKRSSMRFSLALMSNSFWTFGFGLTLFSIACGARPSWGSRALTMPIKGACGVSTGLPGTLGIWKGGAKPGAPGVMFLLREMTATPSGRLAARGVVSGEGVGVATKKLCRNHSSASSSEPPATGTPITGPSTTGRSWGGRPAEAPCPQLYPPQSPSPALPPPSTPPPLG